MLLPLLTPIASTFMVVISYTSHGILGGRRLRGPTPAGQTPVLWRNPRLIKVIVASPVGASLLFERNLIRADILSVDLESRFCPIATAAIIIEDINSVRERRVDSRQCSDQQADETCFLEHNGLLSGVRRLVEEGQRMQRRNAGRNAWCLDDLILRRSLEPGRDTVARKEVLVRVTGNR